MAMHTYGVMMKPDSLSLPVERGFTLIELMIVLGIMAILMAAAAPSFTEIVLGSKLNAYANNLVASTNLARSEAIKRNSPVTLCVSNNGTSCTSGGWERGWIVKTETPDGTQLIRVQPAASAGLRITDAGALTSLDFDPSGVGTTSATLNVCRATPTAGSQEREVKINATGRASVTKTTTGTCP